MFEWIKKLLESPKALSECKAAKSAYLVTINQQDKDIVHKAQRLNQQVIEIEILSKQVSDLKKQLPVPDVNEIFWNNKYPKKDISYLRHETDGNYEIDVRNFVSSYRDFNLPTITGATNDEKALNSLIWVIANITYIEDKKEYGYDEYWAMPWQTLKRRKGDCEDGSNLLHAIMLKAGIPYWRCRSSAGDTPYGGHAYTTYLIEDNSKWVILDWCFFSNKKPVQQRLDYKEEKNYGNVWFSYNQQFSFSKGVKETNAIQNKFLKKFSINKKR